MTGPRERAESVAEGDGKNSQAKGSDPDGTPERKGTVFSLYADGATEKEEMKTEDLKLKNEK